MPLINLYVNVSVANIYKAPSFESEVATQALLWEKVNVLASENKWHKVRQWDGYEGWIHQFFTTILDSQSSKAAKSGRAGIVDDLFNKVHASANPSAPVLRDLVFGDMLVSIGHADGWSEVLLPDGQIGWTGARFRKKLDGDIRNHLEKVARRFLGVQYLWGGKSPKGFDCSGFIQTVLKSGDIFLPRDAVDQERQAELEDIDLNNSQKGDLIFFATETEGVNHVAMSLGGRDFIHCSGFVRIERFGSKSRNDNKHLFRHIVSVKSIGGLCD